MAGHDIVVLGASAGGVEALRALLASLPGDLPAALFAVLHQRDEGRPSLLPNVLGARAALRVVMPVSGTRPAAGRVYVAPPDRHLLLDRGRMWLSRGPEENYSRPAIDPLFRTAARAYGGRVVGVILTGLLDDGAAGLAAVRACGGLTVVQDPADADFPDMPRNALQAADAEHCLPLTAIGPVLAELVRRPAGRKAPACPREPEPQLLTLRRSAARKLREAVHLQGNGASLSCPSCRGPLWEIGRGNSLSFACQAGHRFNGESMQAGQSELVERALWTAVSALQDKAALSRRLARRMRANRLAEIAGEYEVSAEEADGQVELLRDLLLAGERPVLPVAANGKPNGKPGASDRRPMEGMRSGRAARPRRGLPPSVPLT